MTEPIATAGDNSYVGLTDANAIASANLFNAAWSAASDSARTRAIITATSFLDRLNWKGERAEPTQELAWPRTCTPTAGVPSAIERATVELASHLLSQHEPSPKPVMQEMIGPSLIMFYPYVSDELPRHVRRLVEPFLTVRSANVAEVQF